MKILDNNQMRNADAYTIKHEPITSLDLMERASEKVADWLMSEGSMNFIDDDSSFHVFCGMGNNGGDGLAVARLLANKGRKVSVYIVKMGDSGSNDFNTNLNRLKKLDVPIKELSSSNGIGSFQSNDIVLDAIFGSGLSRPVEGWIADIIESINLTSNNVVSIDTPSGLFDSPNTLDDFACVIASVTLTFESAHISFFLPETSKFVGHLEVLDIGLDKDFINGLESRVHLTNANDIGIFFKRRPKHAHKGTFGHTLIIGGGLGKIGAITLSTMAALRSGAGLVTAYLPKCGLIPLQINVPEAMVLVDSNNDYLSEAPDIGQYNAVGIGPGMGTNKESALVLKQIIQKATNPLILDADALNILSENKTWLAFLPKNSILTPHPGEFKRLVGEWANDAEMLELLKDLSFKNQLIIVLKGAHSIVAAPDGNLFVNNSGNPGMATAGSGDTLTGIITSFLGQSMKPLEAAIAGVYTHGLAGDYAKSELGERGMIASDIISAIPLALKTLSD